MEQAMYATQETGSDMYDEDDEDLALIAIEESKTEPESNFEGIDVNLFSLKDKLVNFSKKKVILLVTHFHRYNSRTS